MLINQFASARRMNLALGVESLDAVADRLRQFLDLKSPQGLLDKIKLLPMLADMGKFFPKTVSTGPCKDVIRRDNFSLLNIPVLLLAHLVLSGGSYGMSGFFEAAGPLFQVVFWIGLYALVLRYFVGIARGMHRALQLRPPASEWSPENRILLHIHNNFFAVLAVLEGSFLAACYVLYHIDKRFF